MFFMYLYAKNISISIQMLPDNKQIEEWGVIAVKNCLSMTDTLSQFIDENDKTPSWDGSVIIYRNNKRINSDIVGKVAVQVKGRLENKINQKECAFSVDMADLLNYKGNGGVIFFLVLINKQRFNQRKIYYETLTPLKIGSYISGHENQGSRTIKLKELAKDKHEIQTVFLNFYQDSTKQHSFAHIPPISIEDLTKRSDITKISANVEFFAPKKTHPSPIDIFLTHEVYWYAEIKGSPIPHPIEWNPDIIIASTKNLSVFVGDEEYENYVSVINARENTTVSFGKSTTLSIPKTKKGAKINYQLSNSLNDRLKDLAFLGSVAN